MCFVAGWNGFVGRIWPAGNSVENPDIDYEEEWYDITHHCRNPTPTLNDCESTPTTVTQSSEQEYGELRASNRHPSTPCSHNITQSFSRGTGPYTFPRSTKLVNTSLACSQDFLKVWWRVEISSVVLRPRQKPHWVSSSFGFRGILAYTLPGDLAKKCRGWLIHSCLPFVNGHNQFANHSAPFQNAMPLDTHESVKPFQLSKFP